jgi:threonine dehydrogenase-like Zn-dependent dehydrogenase
MFRGRERHQRGRGWRREAGPIRRQDFAGEGGSSLLRGHGGLYYALPRRREMLAALHGLHGVLGGEAVVVVAELGSDRGDRAALLPTVEQGGTARMLEHSPNCCLRRRSTPGMLACVRACATKEPSARR